MSHSTQATRLPSNRSTESLHTQRIRLKPADVLAARDITSLVWAEDALSFVHSARTGLGELQLIVEDIRVANAVQEITRELPYRRDKTPHWSWIEWDTYDPWPPSCYPYSISLSATTHQKILWKTGKPARIYIHPQSFFSVNVNDQNRTLALDHFSPKIRFPTLPAFIDSLTAVLLDPPLGYLHSCLATFMRGYLAELLYFPFQGNNPLKPNGELCKNYASVAQLLREENRPYFVSYLKRHGKVVWEQEVEIRRAILEKMGSVGIHCSLAHETLVANEH